MIHTLDHPPEFCARGRLKALKKLDGDDAPPEPELNRKKQYVMWKIWEHTVLCERNSYQLLPIEWTGRSILGTLMRQNCSSKKLNGIMGFTAVLELTASKPCMINN